MEDVLSGKVQMPRIEIEPDFGEGIQALGKKFPELQVEWMGAMTWPGASEDN